ncbi:sulfotransferase [uncultured Tateyamaria sp.]|uniref:sulfotransferase family protein n=1 Tax=uncultured Tateyamaria sp. TaxID=455651 RepID=UPI0026119325|nr:sulfotransferase [uncultured Tateyamaria sp.]
MSIAQKIEQEIERCNTLASDWTLPTFLILGAMKSGTTTLHAHLASHPDLFAPHPKELHFFNQHFLKGLPWYAGHFDAAQGRICFETTPAYLFEPDTGYRVQATLPDAKFLIILRDPVDRCVSHYHHMLRTRRETLPFAEAIGLESSRTDKLYAQVKTRALVHSPELKWFSYVRRGHYIDQLQTWTKLFPKDRFLVLDFQDLCDSPQSVVDQVTDFLCVPGLRVDSTRQENAHARGGVSAQEEAELRDLFAPYNARLEAYLGRKLSWM